MSYALKRVADFARNAAGHRISLRLPSDSLWFLLMQDQQGSTLLYAERKGDGRLLTNGQRDGVWLRESLSTLPPANGAEITLTFDIMQDHVLIRLNEQPWSVADLGHTASAITAVMFSGEGEATISSGCTIHSARHVQICDGTSIVQLPGESMALVASRWLLAAVSDALVSAETVMVAAPLPWQLAEAAVYFDKEIESGRVVPLRGWPADVNGSAWLDAADSGPQSMRGLATNVEISLLDTAALIPAMRRIGRLYVDGDEGGLPALSRELKESADQVIEIIPLRDVPLADQAAFTHGCIRRPETRLKGHPARWLPSSALARMGRSAEAKGLLAFRT